MTFHNAPVRFDHGRPLGEDEMRRHAPGIFAVAAHHSRSERFAPIPTIEVLRGLAQAGFQPVSAKQSLARIDDRRDFTKHMIRLRRFDGERAYAVGDTVCEIVLKNANDGTAAYELLPGLFRIRCLNGMVVKTGEIEGLKVRHTGKDIVGQVIEGTYTVLEDAKLALAAPEQWSQIKLEREEAKLLANGAHALRFTDSTGVVVPAGEAIKSDDLLTARRTGDQQNDLWTTFNVVQENVIRGGLSAYTRDANNNRRRVTTREIKGIDQDIRLNRALFTLAAEMAKLKGAPLAA